MTAPTNVFLRYLQANNTSLVSRMEGQGAAGSDCIVVTLDLRGRAADRFHFVGRQPVDRDNDLLTNVFVRHAYYGTTTLINRASGADGATANGASFGPAIAPGSELASSAFVAFASDAANLVEASAPGGPRTTHPQQPANFTDVFGASCRWWRRRRSSRPTSA